MSSPRRTFAPPIDARRRVRMHLTATALILLSIAAAGVALAEVRTIDYAYDGLGRLVSATDGVTQIDYSYDPGGNLLGRSVPEPSGAAPLLIGLATLAALARLTRGRRGGGREARSRTRDAETSCAERPPDRPGWPVLVAFSLSALMLSAASARANLSGDPYGVAMLYGCSGTGERHVIHMTNGVAGPCPNTALDGLTTSCGTNIFTGAGMRVTETQSFDGTNTKITISIETDDGSDMLPGGLFCAPGQAIDSLEFILGKISEILASLQDDPAAHGLTPELAEILTSDVIIEGLGGAELARFSLGLEGSFVTALQRVFTLFGANSVPVTAMRFCFELAGQPAAPPPHSTHAEQYETGDFSTLSDEVPLKDLERDPRNQAPPVDDPVIPTTGESVRVDEVDITVGGRPELLLARSYASYAGEAAERAGVHGIADGPLGAHWSHNYHLVLQRESASQVKLLHRKGAVLHFAEVAGVWTQQSTGYRGIPYQLVASGSKLELMDPTVRRIYRYEFTGTPDGSVAPVESIRDRNGNTQTLTYNPDGTLASVTGLERSLSFTHVLSGGVQRIAEATDQAGRSVRFDYDGARLETVTDARNEMTRYAYDASDRMTSVMRPRGNLSSQTTYLSSGRVLTQTDGEGGTFVFLYDTSQTTVIDPLGNTRRYDYDVDGQVTGVVDEAGNTITQTYDASQRLLDTTDRRSDTRSLGYHAPSGYVSSRTDAAGNTWTYVYGAQAQEGFTFHVMERIDYPDATSVRFVYDANGNVTSVTDGENNVTTYTYNGRGQALSETNGAAGVTTWTYNTDGTVATRTDDAGNVTSYGYDAAKRMTSVLRPGPSPETFTYDPGDHLLSVTDENNHTTSYSYDANGNLSSLTDHEGDTTSFVYDDNDKLLQVIDPDLETRQVSYDLRRMLASMTDARGQTVNLEYDGRGRFTRLTDEEGRTSDLTYDDEGVLVSTTDPLGQVKLIESDESGRFTRIEDDLGNARTFVYDELGRLVQQNDALGRLTTIQRDGVGDPTAVHLDLPGHSVFYRRNALRQVDELTDTRGETWQRFYDDQGRLASQTDPLGNTESYTYDSRNRLDEATLPGSLGSVDYVYDPGDRLLSVDFSDGTSFVQTYADDDLLLTSKDMSLTRDNRGLIVDSNSITITYDPNTNIETVTYEPGKTVTYTYTARDQLETISDWDGGVTTYSYDDAGRLERIDHPNGTSTTYSYDTADRMVGITESVGASISLTLDDEGQITQAIRDLPLQPSASPTEVSLTYDEASQESGADHDALGRLLRNGTYSWNLANQLVSYGEGPTTVSFTRDRFGNVVTRTEGGATRSFVWNYALRLPSIATENLAGAPIRHYITTPDGHLVGSLDAGTTARRVYHYDEMGNTVFVTDGAGQVIQSYAYSPYGEVLAENGGLDNFFTYHGRTGAMREGNLYSMRARYYDPVRARFITRDPLRRSIPRHANPYQALLQNPLCFVDPLGTDEETATPQDGDGESAPAPRCGCVELSLSCEDEKHRIAFLESETFKLFKENRFWQLDEKRITILNDGLEEAANFLVSDPVREFKQAFVGFNDAVRGLMTHPQSAGPLGFLGIPIPPAKPDPATGVDQDPVMKRESFGPEIDEEIL